MDSVTLTHFGNQANLNIEVICSTDLLTAGDCLAAANLIGIVDGLDELTHNNVHTKIESNHLKGKSLTLLATPANEKDSLIGIAQLVPAVERRYESDSPEEFPLITATPLDRHQNQHIINTEVGYISFCYLSKQYQQKGFGTKILTMLLNKAKDLGYRTIYLQTTSNRIAALKLYSKNGFTFIKNINGHPYPLTPDILKQFDFQDLYDRNKGDPLIGRLDLTQWQP